MIKPYRFLLWCYYNGVDLEMTDKRFILDEYFEIGSVIVDTENENVRFKHENKLSMKQCCNLLNEQHERIQQLQDENYGLKQTVAQLLKESKETSQKEKVYKIQPYAIMKRNGDVE